eukprot:TRINITY_DN6709_c0_g1_i2.p1 TRINITY_DN6709_c0_g1~~TRINITY_DN6709_c0_g1_i2.p1  ORF type:complete len:113 (-),score=37.21 TRINITY_DN6709_c0_g1_i2:28-366(-)
MLRSLVGSEMCIRDRCSSSSNSHSATLQGDGTSTTTQLLGVSEAVIKDAVEKIGGFGKVVRTCIESAEQHIRDNSSCLLYTSDAADEEDSVDLGGRRLFKQKKNNDITGMSM